MRMRKKKNLPRRMEAVKSLLVENPAERRGCWRASVHAEMLEHGQPSDSADTPFFVELGCGKGSFCRALAVRNPNAVIVAVEKVPDVLVMAMEAALKDGLTNLRFVLGDAETLSEMFAEGEISRLFINFCDPWPHWKQAHRRLLHRGFLERYRPLLHTEGTLRFKTDNAPLFAFAQKELSAADWTILSLDSNLPLSDDNIETEYEARFRALGTPIGFLEAKPDEQLTNNN